MCVDMEKLVVVGKRSICLKVRLSKTCSNPIWLALKQLRNSRNYFHTSKFEFCKQRIQFCFIKSNLTT